MKTAVIYARYSSERQTEQSIEGQLHVCNDYAKRNDLVIVGTYIDRAMTGTNDNREDFQRMLKDSDRLCSRLQIRPLLPQQVRDGDPPQTSERQRR